MRPPASKFKRKPNDSYEPLMFKQDDVRKMTAKEQGEDLLRILIAGLQRKLNLPPSGSQLRRHSQARLRRGALESQGQGMKQICALLVQRREIGANGAEGVEA